MGRILAIDYGKKRTGLAVSDPMKMIAGGLTTLSSPDVIVFIKEYMEKEDVDLIILGEPRQLNYEPSENGQRVEIFKKNLIRAIPSVTVAMVDERFTSALAHQAMLQGGLKKKDRRNKELVDELSAVILLQSYLETIRI
jgi:putative Holliday junction resolvase